MRKIMINLRGIAASPLAPRNDLRDIKLGGERGSMTVWMVMMIPMLTVIMLFLVNLTLMVDSKLRMQSAVDRGLYAGSAYLAETMNRVARLNKDYRDGFLELKRRFGGASQQTKNYVIEEVGDLHSAQGRLYNDMNSILESAYGSAQEIADEVARANLESAPLLKNVRYLPKKGFSGETLFQMVDDLDDGVKLNEEELSPANILGEAYDPKDWEEDYFLFKTYLKKDPGLFVAMVGEVSGEFQTPFLPEFLGEGMTLGNIAASQPYSGSIKDYAFSGDEELLYHPSLIPTEEAYAVQ